MTQAASDNTQRLVVRARDGDASAMEHLCSVYGERVRRIIRLRMGAELRSKLESTDIVQDTLLSALRDLESFNYSNEGDFLRWLSAIAENQIRGNLDRLHAAKRDIRKEVPLEQRSTNATSQSRQSLRPAAYTTPSLILTRREDMDKLERAMDQLKPEYRRIIMLARIEGLQHKNIASDMGKSPEAVGMMLSRAMLALIKAFERL